jgi:hypothetical protein
MKSSLLQMFKQNFRIIILNNSGHSSNVTSESCSVMDGGKSVKIMWYKTISDVTCLAS